MKFPSMHGVIGVIKNHFYTWPDFNDAHSGDKGSMSCRKSSVSIKEKSSSWGENWGENLFKKLILRLMLSIFSSKLKSSFPKVYKRRNIPDFPISSRNFPQQ